MSVFLASRQSWKLPTCFLAMLHKELAGSRESASLYSKGERLITAWEPDEVNWHNTLADQDIVGWLFISCTVSKKINKKQPSSTWRMFAFVLRCHRVAGSHDRRLRRRVFSSSSQQPVFVLPPLFILPPLFLGAAQCPAGYFRTPLSNLFVSCGCKIFPWHVWKDLLWVPSEVDVWTVPHMKLCFFLFCISFYVSCVSAILYLWTWFHPCRENYAVNKINEIKKKQCLTSWTKSILFFVPLLMYITTQICAFCIFFMSNISS